MIIYVNFLKNRTLFKFGKQAFASYPTWLLRSEENVIPVIFDTKGGVWENVFPQYFQYLCMVGVVTIHVGRSYSLGRC